MGRFAEGGERRLVGRGDPNRWSEPASRQAVADPRGVLKEFGTALGEDVQIRVWDSTSEMRYLVLPERPTGTEKWHK